MTSEAGGGRWLDFERMPLTLRAVGGLVGLLLFVVPVAQRFAVLEERGARAEEKIAQLERELREERSARLADVAAARRAAAEELTQAIATHGRAVLDLSARNLRMHEEQEAKLDRIQRDHAQLAVWQAEARAALEPLRADVARLTALVIELHSARPAPRR